MEKKGRLDNVKYVLTWAYHEYNPPLGLVTSSLYLASRIPKMQFVLACPEEYTPPQDILDRAAGFAAESGIKAGYESLAARLGAVSGPVVLAELEYAALKSDSEEGGSAVIESRARRGGNWSFSSRAK